MNIYLGIAIGGMLGTVIHTFVKIAGINRRLNTTNYRQVLGEYWKTDWAIALLSVFVVMTIVFISNEWLNLDLENIDEDKTPRTAADFFQLKISQYTKTVAVILGYCADSAVNTFLGGTERKLIKKAKEEGYEMDEIIKSKKDE